MNVYPKHDHLLNRDLRPRERLEPQRKTLWHIRNLLDSLENTLSNASDHLTENDLLTIADAVQYAYNAVENAAMLGQTDFYPRPVRPVRWGERDIQERSANMTLSELIDTLVDIYQLYGDQTVNLCVDARIYTELDFDCVDDTLYIEGYEQLEERR